MGESRRSDEDAQENLPATSLEETDIPSPSEDVAASETSGRPPLEAWIASMSRVWPGREPLKSFLAGQLNAPEARRIKEVYQVCTKDKEAHQSAWSALSRRSDEILWFFRGDEFAFLQFPPDVLEEAFRAVGDVPHGDVLAKEAEPWVSKILKILLARSVRNAFSWGLLKLLPEFAEKEQWRDAWIVLLSAKELESPQTVMPAVISGPLQDSMLVWAERFDFALCSALQMAKVDFSKAPGYGTEAFRKWMEDVLTSTEGQDAVCALLAERLGTSEAAAAEIQRLVGESIHVLDDPAFAPYLMHPKDGKRMAKLLRKKKFELAGGKTEAGILREIFCRKPEDHISNKEKKRIIECVEKVKAQFGPDQAFQVFRCVMALELLRREYSQKDPFLIQYMIRPALQFYRENYA